MQKLREDVIKYNRLLRDLGLRDHQVPAAKKASYKTFGLLIYRIGLLLAWSLLALPGTILNGPMFILASLLSRKKAKEALAASTVKIAGRDVLATWKILISLGVAPILYFTYAVLATIIASKAGASTRIKILTPFLVVLALPFMNYAALKFGEAGMDVLKSVRPLVVALVPGQQRLFDNLRTMRQKLSNEVADVINEYGPKLYDDFDQFRILVPASAPPSTGEQGVWRRKSSVGGVDAQGSLLIHPMTWLDERLFGWSHSSKRGTSAWGGTTPSQMSSRPETPDISDDEDHGDYDHVVHILHAYEDTSRNKIRSRHGSYADLQKLRMSNSASTGIESESSAVSRRSPRQRKKSLSDLIPVDRIGDADRDEPFEEVTTDLNKDASHGS